VSGMIFIRYVSGMIFIRYAQSRKIGRSNKLKILESNTNRRALTG
jgi:hypothetical protein